MPRPWDVAAQRVTQQGYGSRLADIFRRQQGRMASGAGPSMTRGQMQYGSAPPPNNMMQAPMRTPSGLFSPVSVGAAAPVALPWRLPQSLPSLRDISGASFNQPIPQQQGPSPATQGVMGSSVNMIATTLGISPQEVQAAIDNGTIKDLVAAKKAELEKQHSEEQQLLNAAGGPSMGAANPRGF